MNEKKFVYRPFLLLLTLVTYVLAYFYFDIMGERSIIVHFGNFDFNLRFFIFTLAFIGITELTAVKFNKTRNRESIFWLITLILLSILWCIRTFESEGAFSPFLLLFLHCNAAYYVLMRMEMTAEGKTGPMVFFDFISAFIITPFSNFLLRIIVFVNAFKNRSFKINKRKHLPVLTTVIITLILVTFASSLLSNVDTGFAGLTDGVLNLLPGFDSIFDNYQFFRFITRFIISIPVGAFLMGLIGGSAIKNEPEFKKESIVNGLECYRHIPKFAVITVLAALSTIYIVFFIFQIRTIIPVIGSDSFTAPEASRLAVKGFYELIKILILNFSVLGTLFFFAPESFTEFKDNRVKFFATLFATTGICFAILDYFKLYLYVANYGFTSRRLVACWFLLVMFTAAILMLIRLYKKFEGIRYIAVLFIVSFILFAFSEGTIVQVTPTIESILPT
nr:DUF4153 domain-containing protein [uncultured Catonella sp.]